MDIASGTFTAQTGGLYTITYSGRVDLHPSSNLALDLLHNGSPLKEGHAFSYCGTDCGDVDEMLSRTLVSSYLTQISFIFYPAHISDETFLFQIVSLAVGDTIQLEATHNDINGLYYLTMCVSLIAFPYGH